MRIPLLHWASDRPQISGVLNVVARAIVDQDPESAAVIQGAARQLAVPLAPEHRNSEGATSAQGQRPAVDDARFPGGLIVDVRRETTLRIDDALGTERRQQLRTVGDAMDEDQAVTYTLSRIHAALDAVR